MTPGSDAETADGMTVGKIERIIDALRHERYRFKPVKRHYIPKKDGKQRPLGLPSWSDKLLGEVVRLLLEAYYEPQFSDRSHGYRPDRGCHTALREEAVSWTGVTWFIEGDISQCLMPSSHCFPAAAGSVKEGVFGLWDQYSQAFSTSAAHVDSLELAVLYTLQHSLAADAEDPHRVGALPPRPDGAGAGADAAPLAVTRPGHDPEAASARSQPIPPGARVSQTTSAAADVVFGADALAAAAEFCPVDGGSP